MVNKTNKRKGLQMTFLIALGLLIFALAGCGGKDQTTPSNQDGQGEQIGQKIESDQANDGKQGTEAIGDKQMKEEIGESQDDVSLHNIQDATETQPGEADSNVRDTTETQPGEADSNVQDTTEAQPGEAEAKVQDTAEAQTDDVDQEDQADLGMQTDDTDQEDQGNLSDELKQESQLNQETQENREESVTESAAGDSNVSVSAGTTPLICIDPGHQLHGNSAQEPIGPGASQTKAKVTGGATGVSTGLTEYELNLEVALKLQSELIGRGYQVVMTRSSNDVDLSNADRAAIANQAGADAFIRIHANGCDDASVNGAEALCQTASNPYNASLYNQSYQLSSCVLSGMVNATGCRKRSVITTDNMSGINWCQVPVTILEMGYLSNPTEDANMANDDYQWKIARGIADGIDDYFSGTR